jgi:DNA polymerase (family 10)
MDKKEIAALLDEMGTLLELQGANPFKSRAFHNASRAVEGITQELAGLIDAGRLLEVKGIGKSIAEIITDLVKTGKSREYTDLRKQIPDGVLDMLRIQGLGPKRVKILWERLKIRNLDELEHAAKGGKLAALEGFGEKTQENILKGIESLRSRSDKSLYPVAAEAAEKVFAHMKKQKGVVRGAIAGSLRRRKEVIGDIDILLSASDDRRLRLMDAFVAAPGVESVVAKGETKSSVLLEGGISCDLRIVGDDEFPFALNYFTGSKEHNVDMRSRAKRFGLSLNEYGFSRVGEEEKRGKAKRAVKCKTEEDIYRALELQYVPPELRESTGELEVAEKNRLPSLIEEKDIRGTLHCHTTYSDGVNTLEQMVAAARELGWEYLGIADHSKAAAYAGGLTEEKVKAQLKEIESLNGRLRGFRIFTGTECDILPNGDLDWTDRVLSWFDHVVVSVHSSFKMSEPDMTRRIIKALKNKHVTMLGHPTGRLLLSRDPYPVDLIQVIDAAADYGKMIEINAHPMRLDLDWRLCRYAKEKGVLIPINPDAHNTDGLKDVYYGVATARKGWLTKRDVLNTRSTKELETLLAARN